jgi:hypothetical protein
MRNFLYLLPCFIFVLLIEIWLGRLPNLYSLKRQHLESQANETEVLVLGACDGQSAFKPSEWRTKGYSLATASQSLTVSSQLMDYWVKRLPQLKKVIVSTSYFLWNLNSAQTSEYWRNYFYFRFFGIRGELEWGRFLDLRGFSLFFLYWPFSRSWIWEARLGQLSPYQPLSNERVPIIKELPQDGFVGFARRPASEFSAEWADRTLRGILQWTIEGNEGQILRSVRSSLRNASQRGIETLFVRTPVHPLFAERLNRLENEKEAHLIGELQKEFLVRLVDRRTFFRIERRGLCRSYAPIGKWSH